MVERKKGDWGWPRKGKLMGIMSEQSEQQFDEQWHLPEKFRLTAEALAANDERQREWRALFGAFTPVSPQQKARRRALTTRDHYEAAGNTHLLPAQQRVELAAAFAELGRFDLAAMTSPAETERAEYYDIWLAVLKSESEWCRHPEKHQYAERDVFSVKLDRDAILLRCNLCGFRNVAALPNHIAEGREKRKRYRLQHLV